MPALKVARDEARRAMDRSAALAQRAEIAAAQITDDVYAGLQHDWDAQRDVARAAGNTVREGAGKLGQRLRAVNRAGEKLARWSTEWQPVLGWMPTRTADIASQARWFDDAPRLRDAFEAHARTAAESAVLDYTATRDAAAAAARAFDDASREYRQADAAYRVALDHYGNLARTANPASALAETELLIGETQGRVNEVEALTASLLAEPTLRVQPPDRLDVERDLWQINRDMKARELR